MNRLLLAIAAVAMLEASSAAQSQTGVVTGVLRLVTGEPAVGVRVAATALSESMPQPGEAALVSLTTTDNSGRYRLDNILPGRYYIQAGLVDLPTYYPGVTATAGATSILIGAGAVIDGIDFSLSRSVGVRVSGRVPLIVPKPVLVSMRGGGTLSFRLNTSPVGSDGTFEFLKVSPGTYTLNAVPNNRLPPLQIVVNDKDIDVGLPAGPAVKVSGRVGLGSRSPRPAGLKVVLTGASAWAQVETPIDAAGNFEVAVPPGAYTVRTLPGNPTSQATIAVGSSEITGVVVPAYAEITGQVVFQDGRQMPAFSPALTIVAKPEGGSSIAALVRADGALRFPLSEGVYRISFGQLPAGISVKSLLYGSIDLLQDPLKLDGELDLHELRVTLETRP